MININGLLFLHFTVNVPTLVEWDIANCTPSRSSVMECPRNRTQQHTISDHTDRTNIPQYQYIDVKLQNMGLISISMTSFTLKCQILTVTLQLLYNTRSSATAERQRVSYARLPRLACWSCTSLSTAKTASVVQLCNRLAELVSTLSANKPCDCDIRGR